LHEIGQPVLEAKLTRKYRDEKWKKQSWTAEGAISELIQQQFDHLNGILCTMRAIDEKSLNGRDKEILVKNYL
jgi:peptide deformylase